MSSKTAFVSIVAVVAVACGGGSTSPESTSATTTATPPSTAAGPAASSSTTTTTEVATTESTEPAAEAPTLYFVGGSDLAGSAIYEGWNINHTMFVHDTPERLELGIHTLLVYPPCGEPAPPQYDTLMSQFDPSMVPADPCDVRLHYEQIATQGPGGVTVDRSTSTYEIHDLTNTLTLRYVGDDGSIVAHTVTSTRDDVRLSLSPGFQDDYFGLFGTLEFPTGAPGVGLAPSMWPHPYDAGWAEAFLEVTESYMPEPPVVRRMDNAPESGLTAVWFECRRDEASGNGFDAVVWAAENDACREQTAEAQRIADALGWQLEVVTYLPGNHSAQAAYPEALTHEPDVIFAAGGLAGQWSDSTISGLLNDGVTIIDNGIDDAIGGSIDRSALPWVQGIEHAPPAPWLDTWLAVDGGFESVVLADFRFPSMSPVCGGCFYIQPPAPECHACPPSADDIASVLLGSPAVTHITGVAGEIFWRQLLTDADRTDVVLVGQVIPDEPLDLEPRTGPSVEVAVAERVWWLFDAALRTRAAAAAVPVEYDILKRWSPDGAPVDVDDAFRAAFLDAWGVG